MKRKSTEEVGGWFNILLVGDNPHAISIADNIHAHFLDGERKVNFNIVGDIESQIPSHSWFNEFIFDLTTTSGFNNIVVSRGFKEWMKSDKTTTAERVYIKMLLQAMNTIIIDISPDKGGTVFDDDIPQREFNLDGDFLQDTLKWIDEQVQKVLPKVSTIMLIRSLSGKGMPYIGDVFGCLSGNKYKDIICSDKMRFNIPILFDEFCKITKGRDLAEVEQSIITRTNSALMVFFK